MSNITYPTFSLDLIFFSRVSARDLMSLESLPNSLLVVISTMMGIVALSGALVNDSLVLIDFTNKQMAKGFSVYEAIHSAGKRRFRPIILTTLTTFGGLAPMIFETSKQARFMIPMALSLGFGILFSTVIILVIVPNLVIITYDIGKLMCIIRASITHEKSNNSLAIEQQG